MLLVPPAALFLTNGTAFFRRTYTVPIWAAALTVGFVLALGVLMIATALRQHARMRRKWQWRGLEWELTPAFWDNLEVSPYSVHHSWTLTVMRGPFCSKCDRPVSVRLLKGGESCPFGCGQEYNWEGLEKLELPDQWSTGALDIARFAAYVDAIGAARRGEI